MSYLSQDNSFPDERVSSSHVHLRIVTGALSNARTSFPNYRAICDTCSLLICGAFFLWREKFRAICRRQEPGGEAARHREEREKKKRNTCLILIIFFPEEKHPRRGRSSRSLTWSSGSDWLTANCRRYLLGGDGFGLERFTHRHCRWCFVGVV